MILNVLMQKQLMDQWCWAAVASSISFYFNSNNNGLYHGDIAGPLISPDCAGVNSNSAGSFSQCDIAKDLGLVLQKTKNYAWELSNALSMDQVADQLNGGYPICCQINWPGLAVAHYIIVYGLDGTNLLIGDPALNNFWADYTYLTTNYGNHGGIWGRTIGTQAQLTT